MTIQDSTRTASVPQQAGPADPPLAPAEEPAPAAPARLVGAERPLTVEERQFLVGAVALSVILSIFIVTFLVLAQYVWT